MYLKLLDLKSGRRVLDLACGQGVFSRFLLEKRIKPEGTGFVRRTITHGAFSFYKDHSISFRRCRVMRHSFMVKSLMVSHAFLQYKIWKKLNLSFKNVARWLKPKGKFVMVLTHPCFRIPRQTHWGWDDDKKMEYRRVDRYANEMKIPILTPPFIDKVNFTMTYHRPLQNYFSALLKAGLCVDSLEEWMSNKESALRQTISRGENRARKEVPLFMAISAVRSS